MIHRGGTEYELEVGGGAKIRANVLVPDESWWPAPTVLFCHGFKGFKDWGPWPWLTTRLADAGFVVHRFNFSHCGVGAAGDRHDEPERFAVNHYGRELEDLHFLLDRLAETPVPEGAVSDRLGIVGHSRGGMVSLLLGGERAGIDALVTLGSPGFSDRFPDETKEEWRRNGSLDIVNKRTGEILKVDVSVLDDYETHRDRYDVAAAIRRRTVPTLVVHGDGDESVPVEEAHILTGSMDPETSELLVLPGAGHTFDAAHPFDDNDIPVSLQQVLDGTVQWLERHLR